jgi:hypothetical protein
MKTAKTVCKSILITGLAVAALAWLPSQTLAQEMGSAKGGAQKLMKIQTVEDIQQIDVGDTIVMSCPKCKDTYTQVTEKTFKAVHPEELRTVGTHLCSSCDTKLVTKGVGKQAKDVVVHTCKMCGSKDVSCCLMKKGAGPTPGMEEDKK